MAIGSTGQVKASLLSWGMKSFHLRGMETQATIWIQSTNTKHVHVTEISLFWIFWSWITFILKEFVMKGTFDVASGSFWMERSQTLKPSACPSIFNFEGYSVRVTYRPSSTTSVSRNEQRRWRESVKVSLASYVDRDLFWPAAANVCQ